MKHLLNRLMQLLLKPLSSAALQTSPDSRP